MCIYIIKPVIEDQSLVTVSCRGSTSSMRSPFSTCLWQRVNDRDDGKKEGVDQIGLVDFFSPSPVETICNSRFKDEIEKVSFSTSSLLYISRIIRINARQEEKEDWFLFDSKLKTFLFDLILFITLFLIFTFE